MYINYQKLFLLILLQIFIILSCAESSTSRTFSLTPCPTLITTSFQQESNNPNLYLILIEATNDYYNRGFIRQTADILTETFPKTLQPYDRVALGWINDKYTTRNDLNSIIYFDQVIRIPATPPKRNCLFPAASPTPIPYPTRKATPYTDKGIKIATQTALPISATNTAIINHFFCEAYLTQEACLKLQRDYRTQTQNYINKFSQEIANIILSANAEFKNEKARPIFEALQLASRFMKLECNGYNRCVVIMFSTMDDWRRTWDPARLNFKINFPQNTSIIVVMLDCRYDDGLCHEKKNDWTRHFEDIGVNNKAFFVFNTGDLPSKLTNLLKEGRAP